MVMKLSKNFTLEEMVATSHKGLQDTPTLEVVQNLATRGCKTHRRWRWCRTCRSSASSCCNR